MSEPYRDVVGALRERRHELLEEVATLDAMLAELSRHRVEMAPRAGVGWWLPSGGAALLSAGLVATTLAPPWRTPDRREAARRGADHLRAAAAIHMALGDATGCPTTADLISGGRIEARRTDDPWGRPYRIACKGDGVEVTSDGRDGRKGTSDDVVSGP